LALRKTEINEESNAAWFMPLVITNIFALLTLGYDAPIERLKGPDIVRI
jgi:hypothetical protein